MPTRRVWLGHAPDVAQIEVFEFDSEACTILAERTHLEFEVNDKVLVVQAPDTVADVAPAEPGDTGALLALLQAAEAAINSSTIPEFAELEARVESPDGSADAPYHRLVVTTREAYVGVPFEIEARAPYPTIDVDVVQQGGPGTNAQQAFHFVNEATSGTFAIQWDPGTGTETSENIPYNGNAAAVHAALVAGMASVATGDLVVGGSGTPDEPFVVTFQGAYASQVVNPLVIDTSGLTGGGVVTISTVQDGSVGEGSDHVHQLLIGSGASYKLRVTLNGQTYTTVTLYHANTPDDVRQALEALPNVGVGNVTVYGGLQLAPDITSQKDFYLHWNGALAGQFVRLELVFDTLTALLTVVPGGLPAWSELYVLETHGATGGTFTLSHDGNTTAAIASNAPVLGTTDSVDFKLEQLTSIGFEGIHVVGARGIYSLLFRGTHAFQDVPDLTADFSGLTGSGVKRLTKLFDGGKMGEGSLFQNDQFTDADGTALTTHTSDSGHAWTVGHVYGASFAIQGNKARLTLGDPEAGGFLNTSYLSEVTHANFTAAVNVTLTPGVHGLPGGLAGGIVFRFSNTTNYWVAELAYEPSLGDTGSKLRLRKFVGGVSTVLAQGTVAHDLEATHTLHISATGGGMVVWTDQETLSAYDEFNQGEVRHGIAGYGLADDLVELDVLTFRALTTSGQNEIQSVHTNGTSGTFTLRRPGFGTTSGIAPDASAAAVKAALEAVYGSGNIASVSGTGVSSDPWLVTFGGTLAHQNLPPMTGDGSNMTGLVEADLEILEAGSPPLPMIWDVFIHCATGGTFALELLGRRTADLAYGVSAAALQAALEALGPGDFTGLWEVALLATDSYRLTTLGRLAGRPLLLIADNQNLVGLGQGITQSTRQAATGRYWIDNPVNYRDAATGLPGLPEAGDEVFVQTGDESNSLRYGSLAGRPLKRFLVGNMFRGHIGLPERTQTGYVEYRPTHITLEFAASGQSFEQPNLLIGIEQGQGSGLIRLRTGDDEVHLRIERTGGPVEEGRPAVCWDGQHASSTLQHLEGTVGIAVFAFSDALLAKVVQRGGALRFGEGTAIGAGGFDRVQGETLGRATIGGVPMIFGG